MISRLKRLIPFPLRHSINTWWLFGRREKPGLFFFRISYTINLWFFRRVPVIVHTMGKVGSTSVYRSLLRATTDNVLHSHYLNRDFIASYQRFFPHPPNLDPDHTEKVYRHRRAIQWLVRKGKKARIIILIRDPVGRNFSWFFEAFEEISGVPPKQYRGTIDDLILLFWDTRPEFKSDFSNWFDEEVKKVFGIDVYNHRFPKKRGWVVLSTGNLEILILKCELDDSLKQEIIARYLGLPSLQLQPANLGREKDYANLYQEFLKGIQPPESYLDQVYSSKFMAHFYTPEEINAFIRKWSAKHL